MLLSGLCDTPTRRFVRMRISAGVSVHAVRRDRALAPEAHRLQKRGRRGLVLVARDFDLVARLGEMNDHRRPLARGDRPDFLERGRIERVHRVRRDGRHDEVVAGRTAG